MRRGIGISDITLWMFGGVARMTRDSDSPGTEFKIAIAGPVVTLADRARLRRGRASLGAGGHDFWEAMRVRDQAHTSGILALVAWLASINLLVLVFNLIPAFPLDGGRVARAIAWKVTGDRNRATRGAARLGQGFSYLFIAIGILFFLRGDLINGDLAGADRLHPLQSARGAVMQTEFTSRIEGIRVADVMDDEPVAIPEDASVERALDEYFLRYRWPWFPVVDADAALPRPDRARRRRRRPRGQPDVLRPWRTSSRPTPPERCGCATTRRSSRCWETTPCAGSAPSWRWTRTAACGA